MLLLSLMTLRFRERSVSADNAYFEEWDLEEDTHLQRVQ